MCPLKVIDIYIIYESNIRIGDVHTNTENSHNSHFQVGPSGNMERGMYFREENGFFTVQIHCEALSHCEKTFSLRLYRSNLSPLDPLSLVITDQLKPYLHICAFPVLQITTCNIWFSHLLQPRFIHHIRIFSRNFSESASLTQVRVSFVRGNMVKKRMGYMWIDTLTDKITPVT